MERTNNPRPRLKNKRKARGEVKKLLHLLGEIQNLAGRAKGVYLNDRSPTRAEKLIPILEEIFNKCLEERGRYASEDLI